MSQTHIPIIIPVPQRAKNCIVVNNKTYCEDHDLSNRELGFFILGTLIAVGWFVLAIHIGDKLDNFWITTAMVVGPLVLLGLYLIL